MRLPAGSWLLALGAFGAGVVGAGVASGVATGRLAAIIGAAFAAALGGLMVARLARLDRAIGRALFSPAPDPAVTIATVVACAEAARKAGGAGLAHLAAEQREPLLADGLRLIAVGAAPDVMREVQASGVCWCGGTVWAGEPAMRISVSNWRTDEADIDRSADAIERAHTLVSAGRPGF